MNRCTEQSQSLKKLLEKKNLFYYSLSGGDKSVNLPKTLLKTFFNRGSGANTGLERDYMQPWNISGF